MKYKRVVGYGENERFVIFELNSGIYAVVCCTDDADEVLFYPSWLSAAKFTFVYLTDDVPQNLLQAAAHNLDMQNENNKQYWHALQIAEHTDMYLRKDEEELERCYKNSGQPVGI